MKGYTKINDAQIKTVVKMLPHIKIVFNDEQSIIGELTIDSLRKYRNNALSMFYVYTCVINFKGFLIYPHGHHFGSEYYNNLDTWMGNKKNMNRKLRRFAINAIKEELKVFSIWDDGRYDITITKINWI